MEYIDISPSFTLIKQHQSWKNSSVGVKQQTLTHSNFSTVPQYYHKYPHLEKVRQFLWKAATIKSRQNIPWNYSFLKPSFSVLLIIVTHILNIKLQMYIPITFRKLIILVNRIREINLIRSLFSWVVHFNSSAVLKCTTAGRSYDKEGMDA